MTRQLTTRTAAERKLLEQYRGQDANGRRSIVLWTSVVALARPPVTPRKRGAR